ncbi:putative phage-like protein [Pseudomonas fluorescens]|uniref:Putative phage-like protein n=1 Tax=Pseudomonas fluorescens TaxID=294 RepID=A0A448DNM5_PSEFL|nr:phage tail assembly chaperone [Pseudomonas fluorescens]VEF08451.1 putative phage-like protein [Pseudomonas fluorescens]
MKYLTFNDAGEINGRYDSSFYVALPSDAMEISEALWRSTLNETDGVWRLVDGELLKQPQPVVEPNLHEQERDWRDKELVKLIWLRDRHRDQLELGIETILTPELFTELLVHMQSLRDWPQSPQFPDQAQRPVGPTWIADQDK